MDLVFKIVRRLLRDDEVEFSRNKNFEAFEDPRVKRALRIFKHLRSVENDLLQAAEGDVSLEAVERTEGDVVVRLSYEGAGKSKRTSFLSESEWLLLLESERVQAVLTRLIEQADEPTRSRLDLNLSTEEGL